MTNSSATPCKGLVRLLLVFLLLGASGLFSIVHAAQNNPVLISNETSTRAVALESVTMKAELFSSTTTANFSADGRNRIVLFVMNLDLLAGESAKALSSDAEDAAHIHYPMNVEYVGQVPGFEGIYMIVLRLNDSMGDLGDVLVRLNLHGVSSNRVRVGIGHVGGGPSDDPGAVATPAPVTPPAAVTPLTIAQYQAQFTDPSLAAGPDGIRFLEQATWGPTDTDLAHLRSVGMQAYLNEQFNAADTGYPSLPLYPANATVGCPSGTAPPNCGRDNYSMYPLQTQMIKNAVTGQDQLRQRVAFALHQFIVVGGNGINNEASWMQPYLQTLDANAFGNFRDILYNTTLNPGMGDYLDMVNNSRAAPNENYAREIMQLFSIGVDTLNQDGTPVLDAQGNRKPSYDQNDITSLARVFTGWILAPTKTWIVDGTTQVPNYTDLMRLRPDTTATYDLNQKTFTTLSNGFVVPACSNCTG